MQCQHVEGGKCDECTHMIFVRPAAQGNMKSDFRGFMNNVSHIIISPFASPTLIEEFMVGAGFKRPVQQAA